MLESLRQEQRRLHQNLRLVLSKHHELRIRLSYLQNPKNEDFEMYLMILIETLQFTLKLYLKYILLHTFNPILIAQRITLSFPQMITSLFSSSTALLRSAKASLS